MQGSTVLYTQVLEPFVTILEPWLVLIRPDFEIRLISLDELLPLTEEISMINVVCLQIFFEGASIFPWFLRNHLESRQVLHWIVSSMIRFHYDKLQ